MSRPVLPAFLYFWIALVLGVYLSQFGDLLGAIWNVLFDSWAI